MDSQFRRIIKLIRKTGDKLVVLDHNEPENAYAIMNLDEYEKISETSSDLRGLTEDEMIDKINRDIALWKNDTISDENIDNNDEESLKDKVNDEVRQGESPLGERGFPGGEGDLGQEERKPKKSWSIPSERKKDTEEIIEEDRQYLEEINY
ncbi:MAG: hypothetical protein PF572_02030 [Patescibacteria group bacterium]|jgi:PHD/YefM family antitoxin component YafN of YafNO toxin-antitoxin module|nr:hypothetical protein [Patescibacteria group bacterium]